MDETSSLEKVLEKVKTLSIELCPRMIAGSAEERIANKTKNEEANIVFGYYTPIKRTDEVWNYHYNYVSRENPEEELLIKAYEQFHIGELIEDTPPAHLLRKVSNGIKLNYEKIIYNTDVMKSIAGADIAGILALVKKGKTVSDSINVFF